MPLLLQTCARETALYQLMDPRAAAQADRVLAGYFGRERAAAMLASYAAAYPELDETELRGVTVMTDERYVVRTERLADAHAAHAPVWRSRYDGPYTGMEDDPDPEFARYAHLLHGAHGSDGAGIWQGGDGPAAALHAAWGAFAATGDPGWPRYAPGDAQRDDLRARTARAWPTTRSPRPRDVGGPGLAARHLVAGPRPRLTALTPEAPAKRRPRLARSALVAVTPDRPRQPGTLGQKPQEPVGLAVVWLLLDVSGFPPGSGPRVEQGMRRSG